MNMANSMREDVRAMLRRLARRMLLVRSVEAAAAGGVIGGLAGMVLLVAGLVWPAIPAVAYWPLVLIPAGAVVGMVLAAVRGIGGRRAAMFLDARYALKERLATAAELATASRQDQKSAAECVYRQAIAAVAETVPARPNFWTRTRRTPAALVLVTLLCCVLAILADARRPGPPDEAGAILTALDGASAGRRAEVARAFSAAAEKTDDASAAESLMAMAGAIRIDDEAELRRLIRKLRDAGIELREVLPAGVQRQVGLAGGGPRAAVQPRPAEAGRKVSPAVEPAATDSVSVYNPAYAKTARPAGAPAGPRPDDIPLTVTLNDAWTAARARARRSLADDSIPAEYRPIVRAFFLEK